MNNFKKKIRLDMCLNKICKCGKVVMAKGLCRPCYYKLYWETNKNKKPLKIKELKFCKCGSVSVVKGFCIKCYHKERNKLKKINKPKKESKPKKENKYCKCGNLVYAKSFCRQHYVENRKSKKNNSNFIDTSIKIHEKNTGKFYHKARFGQKKTKANALNEIRSYIKTNKDFGEICYLDVESNILKLKDCFDCEPLNIDMNKIYNY